MDHVDIEVLLAHVLNKDRSWVIAHPEYVPTKSEESRLKKYLDRRSSGEPVAYIVGEKEFYGRRFNVDLRVLIPRPSTEGLVELVLENVKCKMPARMMSGSDGKNEKLQIRKIDTGIVGVFIPRVIVSSVEQWHDHPHTLFDRAQGDTDFGMTLVDIGTGSGCIAITLACERPDIRIIATDISPDALEVAKDNAKRHKVFEQIEFRQGNLLESVMELEEAFTIVSNPPYLKKHPFTSEWNYEPEGALFAERQGMDVLIPLLEQAKVHPYCQGIFVECQEGQVELLGVPIPTGWDEGEGVRNKANKYESHIPPPLSSPIVGGALLG